MRKYLLLIAFIAFYQTSFCQYDYDKTIRKQIDSLKKILPKLKETEKVDCLNQLARKYFHRSLGSWQAEADSARPYILQANKEAKKIGYKKGLGYSFLLLERLDCTMYGVYAQQEKKFDSALFNSTHKNARNAILIGEELNDNKLLAEAYFILEWLLSESTDKRYLNSRIDYMKKALGYFEKDGDKVWLAEGYNELAYNYAEKFDFEAAAEAMKKAIFFNREIGDEQTELYSINSLSNWYWGTGNFENWLEYGKRGIALAEKLAAKKAFNNDNDPSWGTAYFWMSNLYLSAGDHETALEIIRKGRNYFPTEGPEIDLWTTAIGDIHRLNGNYDSALYYLKQFEKKADKWSFGLRNLSYLYIDLKKYDEALVVINAFIDKSKNNDNGRVGVAYMLAANAYYGKKDYETALKYARQAIIPLQSYPRQLIKIQNYEILSKIYHALRRDDSAYHFLTEFMSLRDSLLTRQFIWKLNNYKKEAEEERKTSQINLLNKDNQLKEQKLKQQATLRNSLIIGILSLLLVGVFIFRNLLLKRKNEKLRMQKNLELQQLESEKKQAELHQHAVELEMQALRAQMNPHFIFNCLSSINRFIFKNDNKVASDYLTRFSRLIRMVLMHSQKKLIPLEDELEMLRLYLDLERLRFKDAFDYSITTTNIVDAGAIFIPPLLLQPFCENAVWHGLMHKESKGHLNVTISEVINENEKVLHCVIEDDGIGREKAAKFKSKSAENEKSMGLKITTERVALLNQENNFSTFYKIADILDEKNDVIGTKVELKIKYKESVEEYV